LRQKIRMIYLSLGSNLGDRFAYIEKAIEKIQAQVGEVKKLSPVYETPAWGYEGAPFLNACIGITSQKSPEEVLDILLSIERSLGRVRNQKEGYADRSIDLDILFYDDLVFESSKLQLPHPRLALRQFILTPMQDIAGELLHPKLHKSINALKEACPDEAKLTHWKKNLSLPKQ